MKKRLLLVLVLAISSYVQAQVLVSENVTALPIGNIGTNLTGSVAGAGGWSTVVPVGGSNSDFQVVNTGAIYGNAIQITGSNAGMPNGIRNMFKGVSSEWSTRTNGNNIAEVDFDFYTGPASTSLNSMRVILYDVSQSKMLGGLMINMSSLVVKGLVYANNAGTVGNYTVSLGGGANDVTLSTNTWYKFGFSFNKTTGEVKFRESMGLANVAIQGAANGVDVDLISLIASPGTGNMVSAIGVFDNLNLKASSTDSLLGTQDLSLLENKFFVYPNPANNVVYVSNAESINLKGITVTDLNGRVVKNVNYDTVSDIQITVSDLVSGMYILNIKSDLGTTTKKIIKN